MKKESLKELQTIPFIGKRSAPYLYATGIHSVKDLKNKYPDKLYVKICNAKGEKIDRCFLYVLRMAIYYASHKVHNPELLYWWAWKDK